MTAPERPTAWSVTEVSAALQASMEAAVGQVWIKGEVRELKVHRAGHWYFSLADDKSQLRCVIWKSTVERHRDPAPPEGTKVFLLARPTIWSQRGDLQLTGVRLIATTGVGAQQLAFLRAKQNLERDGLLDPARKRPLPAHPGTIALITSRDGAALQDMVSVARRRWPAISLLLVASPVQGAQAESGLIRAFAMLSRVQADLCILGRGGGAKDDLDAFNSETVCRAVAACPIPVVAAVGHQTDVPLVDLVADLRAATPSAAMEMALPDRDALRQRLHGHAARLGSGLSRRTRLLSERLHRMDDRLRHGITTGVRQARHQVLRLGEQLDTLSPLRTLERGYALPLSPDGRVLRQQEDFRPGERFRLRVVDGEIAARTEDGP